MNLQLSTEIQNDQIVRKYIDPKYVIELQIIQDDKNKNSCLLGINYKNYKVSKKTPRRRLGALWTVEREEKHRQRMKEREEKIKQLKST